MTCGSELVYEGTTYFGFFTKAALGEQKGVQNAQRYTPNVEERARALAPCVYPTEAPFPDVMMRMGDRVSCFIPDGGPAGLGFIQGTKKIDPDDWFFRAHFYQDPVNPGSLGLEAFQQLLKVVAARRWGTREDTLFESMALGLEHEWIYRGQVIPQNKQVTVEVSVIRVNDTEKLIVADGYYIVDDLVIYEMKNFGVRMV